MKKRFLYLISLITIFVNTQSCNSSSKLYRKDDKHRSYNGKLSDVSYSSLYQYLTNTTNAKIKDTIIIKYDYNNETCWDLLDEDQDDKIMGIVTRSKTRIQQILETRQHVSVFEFREPGNNINKIVKWNDLKIIDSSKQLFKLLFNERCTCGSSLIVMPDKRFIFLRSDPHSDVFDFTKKQIEEILSKK
ncbi:MAG: hypothetical protein NTZ47_07755 [Bacteroidetes bacterium]|nr:hypothetical protein [Bacteroidota bacterium]